MSIRAIERITSIHRDTIMRLGVRVGNACEAMLDEKMRNLECSQIQVDEIWGFVAKKQSSVGPEDNRDAVGSMWTFVALDRETKLVPSFLVGKRDFMNSQLFMHDLATTIS
jgi:transposase-like protein